MIGWFILLFCIGYAIGYVICAFIDNDSAIRYNLKIRRMQRLGRNCDNCKYKFLNSSYGSEKCHCPSKQIYDPCSGELKTADQWVKSTVGTKYCKWKPRDE